MSLKSQQQAGGMPVLIELEQSVRRAETLSYLRFVIVNQTRRLIPYDQAVFISLSPGGASPRVTAISSVASVDRTAPFVRWVERMAARETKGAGNLVRHPVSRENLPDPDREDWNSFSPPHILWMPLIAPQQGPMGVLWLSRQDPWTDKDQVLLDHLALTYAHGIQVFQHPSRFKAFARAFAGKKAVIAAALLVCLVMPLPVRLTSLAPVEVVPSNPLVVSSPLNGVVERVLVAPNQAVVPGEAVVRLDDTELSSQVAVAAKSLEVARAQLEKARRGAFIDQKSKEMLAELAAQADLRGVELAYAEDQLNLCILTSAKAGVAVVSRPEEWAGRPVRVGERILSIADPGQVELQILLPVKDAVLLSPGNRVRVFLDSEPLSPREAVIRRSEYEPHLTVLNSLAYRVTAAFTDPGERPRIGLRGTAKVYGKKVSLFYYLFRRPITALRQRMGW